MARFGFSFAAPWGGGSEGSVAVPDPVRTYRYVPAGQVAYGTFGIDVSTYPDLDPSFSLISDQRAIAENLVRRLSTPRGGLAGSPGFGKDVRAYLNAGFNAQSLNRISGDIKRECEADERVAAAAVTCAFAPASGTLSVSIQVTSATGPFTLVLAITAVTIDLITVS